MRQLTMRMFFCYTAVILQLSESVLSAQTCVIGQNQPAQRTNGGYFVAFPEYGARAYFGGQWTSMTSSGVRYVYCDVGPDSALCQNTAGGDLNFTATQKNAMTTAFSNWTSANATNGSNVSFTQVSSSLYGYQPFAIELQRVLTSAMDPDDAAIVAVQGILPVDYNNDGNLDDYRLCDAIIWVKEDQSTYITEIMAHEIGHTMGLADCPSCDATTVMTYIYAGWGAIASLTGIGLIAAYQSHHGRGGV